MSSWKRYARAFAPQVVRVVETIRDDRQASRTPRPTPDGFKLAGSAAMENGAFEREETAILRELMKAADVFVNVGANVGYYCCHALQLGLYTVAVEPLPVNVRLLLSNIRANDWGSAAEIHPVALADSNGVLEMFGSGTGASLIAGWANNSGNGGVLVPVMRLDDLLGSRFVDERMLIVVDVEGVEDSMLAGATATLARESRPTWMVEINIDEHQPGDLRINPKLMSTFERFWALGYKAWTCTRPCRLVEAQELRAIVDTGRSTLGTHNFIFCGGDGPPL